MLRIERSRPDDLPAVLALLARCGLPQAGLADHTATLLVARDAGRLVGSAALEVYDDGVLLRSVAVAPEARGRGLGRRLTEAAMALAREQGPRRLYLLTETAEAFFGRLGFQPVARADVPPGVRQSVEFASACPASARAMAAVLDDSAKPAPTAQ